tara:strand:- start:678 stop:1052 length:375 start_codon:yes stop_codon:yes gene_type:complete
MQLDSTELPENLYWSNEFDFQGVAQSKQRTVSGGVVVESVLLSYGQSVTLTGAWARRDVVDLLRSMAADVSAKRVLTLNDGTTHAVVFDVEAGGVQAVALSPELNPTVETIYEITLHLLTVEPD